MVYVHAVKSYRMFQKKMFFRTPDSGMIIKKANFDFNKNWILILFAFKVQVHVLFGSHLHLQPHIIVRNSQQDE